MRRVLLMAATMLAAAGLAGSGAAADPPPPGPEAQPGIVTNPSWLRKPSPEEMMAAWPAAAARKGLSGRAAIRCEVDVTGLLQRCTVVDETPAGAGFGAAAMFLVGSFKMKPRMVDGKPVPGGTVLVPIVFKAMEPFGAGPTTTGLSQPVWARAPGFDDMAAAWPKAAADLDSGGAVLRCNVSTVGRLRNCQRYNELPKGKGFGTAAMELAGKFELRLAPGELEKVKGGLINVNFSFLNPARLQGQARKVTSPRWITQLDTSKVVALYPAEAADKGVTSGKGTADCLVAPDGKLTDCKVAREDPAGLGFGQAAVSVAAIMQMNPWTDEGRPVDGARIRLPINFKQADESAPKAKP